LKNSDKISSDLSSKVLTVGTDYQNHRGGVGAVIEVYSQYYEVFKFIPTHKTGTSFSKSFVFLNSLFLLFGKLISDRAIKIVHIHGASYGSFYRKFVIFLISKYIFGKKVVYHMHGGGFQIFFNKSNFISKKLIKFLFAKSDTVICLSQSWIKYYSENFKTKSLVELPNIIDYPVKGLATSNGDIITFLFLGLICKEKGIFDLVNVIAKNKNKYRGTIKLKIGGNGEVKRLQEIIRENQIEDIVEFLGWITHDKKATVLNDASIYILPSYQEGLPISILESMSYGKPIIATRVGGIPEIVKDRENGLLINPGDLAQIQQSLDYFIENPEFILKYGTLSEQMVQKFLPHSVLNELEVIYKSVLINE
jgi:glycosyltransferase involved in cell wall biosynthesis